MQDRIEFLKTIDFLTGAPSELIERIAHSIEVIALPRGREVLADGTVGNSMYFIEDGEVRLEKRGQVLLSRQKGEYIGEMALVDDAPRSAAAVAATDVRLLRWNKDAFKDTLVRNGQIAIQVCRAFSAKIRESVESTTRFKQDLERAIQVQRAMLPEGKFNNKVIDLAAYCVQADEVGGDYYDFLIFDDGQVAVMIADAQGHGFSAALLVAMLKTRLHSQIRRGRSSESVMNALNQTLMENIDDVQMAACCYILIDPEIRKFSFCGAGHIPQYHYCSDTDRLDKLKSENLLLGVPNQNQTAFRAESRSWNPDDLIILCTDGITETRNTSEEEFGHDRLEELILRYKHRKPHEIQENLLRYLEEFHGSKVFDDDVTVLVARLR